MPKDPATKHPPPARRRNRLRYEAYSQTPQRNLDLLIAEVLFGAYWHSDFYKTLPPGLKGWKASLTAGAPRRSGLQAG